MTASKYVVLFAMVALGTLVTHADALNNRPVIGLFAQPSPTSEKPHRQYIAASYVKWIESGGGRVVPMDYYIKAADADKLLDQLSAVVFPGGGSVMPAEARYVYNRIVERNTKGKFFPLWGTCNGFEWIAQAHSHDEILTAYNSYNVSYPIYWAKDAASSRFYRAATPDMRAILANETLSVTMNNHHWGVSTEDFNTHMSKDFYLVSTNKDEDGKPFVSTFEHKKYPVYGVQWHPGTSDQVEHCLPDADGCLICCAVLYCALLC